MASNATWRSPYRLQEAGLVLVILLLAALLTFGGGSVPVGGREVNNFLRVDNVVPNVATTMSWIAIMAVGATVAIAGGGIDISVGSVFGLAALGIMVAQHLQGLDAFRVAADKPLQEGDLDIQLPGFFPSQRLVVGTSFFRHTTAWIVSESEAQV